MKPATIRNLAAAALSLALLAMAPTASAQTVSVSDATVTEGNSGVTNMTFNVTLSAASASVVRVQYLTSGGAATTTSANSSPTGGGVTIPAGAPGVTLGIGGPYPSTIAVAGLTGRVRTLTVTLVGLTHTFAADLDILLVGPLGQRGRLMSDAGGGNNPAGDYTFSDLAGAKLPATVVGTTNDPLPPGTYRPSDFGTPETMTGPAPAGPYGALLSAFNGTDPNGTWSLFIVDDLSGDTGALVSWRLDITTATGDYAGQQGAVEFAIGETAKTIVIPAFGDVALEPNETFNLDLSSLEGAPVTILDGAAVGTINNDDVPTASRVFLSTAGSDANDCSVITTPCLSIAGSLQQVATNGEIIFLVGGEYDAAPITITRGVKINAPTGLVAFVRQPITVNAPGEKVVLRGLTLKGTGSGVGVTLTAADSLYVEDTTFDRWSIGLRASNPAVSKLFVTGSVFRRNGNGLDDNGGAVAGTLISIEQSRFEFNATGILGVNATYAARESTFVGSVLVGADTGPGPSNFQSCEFSGNLIGMRPFGSSVIRLDRNLIHGNGTGIVVTGGTVETLGTNVIRGNTTDVVGVLTVVPGG